MMTASLLTTGRFPVVPMALAAGMMLLPCGLGFAQTPKDAPPPAVTVATVRTQDVSPQTRYIGRVEAVQSVDLRARVEGVMEKVTFQEGQHVDQGQLLYRIEQDTYQATAAHAQAALESAQATLKNAAVNLARYQDLASHGNASRAQLDAAVAQNSTAAAAVSSAEADVKTAQINLGFTTITAPIAGRIGRTAFTAGNLVNASSGALARIVQLDPIRVVFSISERDYVSQIAAAGGATLEQIGAQFIPALQLSNGTDYAQPGKLEFIENEVDPNTGTIALRAAFANPEGFLVPGETVNVTVRRAQSKVQPVVPIGAMEENRDGKFVLLVDSGNKVVQQPIKVGTQVGQNWAVEDGLKGGERLIVEGLQKVQPGMTVSPVDAPPSAIAK
jgi:membrane fusion protein (multidrug efflux system)